MEAIQNKYECFSVILILYYAIITTIQGTKKYFLNKHQKRKKIEREEKEGRQRKRREERWRWKRIKDKKKPRWKILGNINENSITYRGHS